MTAPSVEVIALVLAPYGVIIPWLLKHTGQLGRNTEAVARLHKLLDHLLRDRLEEGCPLWKAKH